LPTRAKRGFLFTKLFTAVAALQLVGEGRLGLDMPVTEVVDLTGTTISPAVTLRHLLTHTSGIADDADEEAGEDYAALWVDKPCYSVVQTRDPRRTPNNASHIRKIQQDTAPSATTWSTRWQPKARRACGGRWSREAQAGLA